MESERNLLSAALDMRDQKLDELAEKHKQLQSHVDALTLELKSAKVANAQRFEVL
jgi:hypothetical protein